MEGVYVDEREDVQKKTFAKWINSQLVKKNLPPILDLFQDLQDGNNLLTLLEILTSKEYKREKGKMRVHHLNNVNKALQILEQNNVKLVNISSNDIVDGSPKLTLGLVWSIILHWQVHYHLKDLMSELQQTNLEKTLLAWCRQNTQNYSGVDIKNFSTSWSDGLAFNALIHRWHPELFKFVTVSKMHPNARLEHAFRVAQELHGIERLLDPEDVNTSHPDKKSIMMYVMCLFQSLPHSEVDADCLDFSIHSDNSSLASPVVEMRSPEGFSAGMLGVPSSRPLSMATNVSVELGGYQRALEDVLTWLLEAEDTLANDLSDNGTLDQIKEHFNAHEQFLLKLAKHQTSVASVLEEGAHMLQEGGLSRDEEDEVRIQMKLLNSRWEDLRVKAMARQSKIHEVLLQRQQQELDNFRQWLTVTEDRISRMAVIGPTYSALSKQISQHPSLQTDLLMQEKHVEALSHMVVVVDDDNNPDAGDSQMEDQLTALSERWTHICKWTEERWALLKSLNEEWEHVSLQCTKLQGWLDTKEKLLKGLEADPALEIGQVLMRIKTLQTARREMTFLQGDLERVQEETSKLDEKVRPGWTGEIQEKIEAIQDRWDALMQIIEVQAQRICNAGFEFNLQGGSTDDQDTNTSIEPKRRRTGTVKRVKFESALDQLNTFMERTQTLLEEFLAISHELSDEQRQRLEDIVQEIPSRQSDVQKLIRFGQELTIEMQTEGADDVSVQREEQKWIDADDRLKRLATSVKAACDAAQYKHNVAFVQTEVSSISVLLDGHRKWLERIDTAPKPHSPTVLADQMRVKLKSMRSHDDRLSRLGQVVQQISENEKVDHQLVTDALRMAEQWAQLQQIYVDRQTQLGGGRTGEPAEMMDTSIHSQAKASAIVIKDITDWVHSTESTLLSDHVALADLPVMVEQMKRFEDLQVALKQKEKQLSEVSKEGQGQELIELSTRCSDIAAILHERQMKLQPYLESMHQFSEEVAGLSAWLHDVESFLQDEQNLPVGDLETLEAQLEQSNALQDDIETLERNVQNVKLSVSKLRGSADDPFITQLDAKYNAVMEKWSKTIKSAKEHNVNLKTAFEKSKMVVKNIEEFFTWLSDIENEIPVFESASSSAELYQYKGKFQALKEKVDQRTHDFRQLNELGNDLMLSSEGPSIQELAKRFTQLNSKWTEVTDAVFSKHRILQDASLQYGEFKALVAQEMDWLDKLEKRLRKSPKSAADAEEISEELDDLENYIRNHPDTRLTRIQEIGQALSDDGVMPEIIKVEVAAATNRWNQLSQQARDRTVLLEVSAAEAQESEGQILELQDWLNHVDAVITSRLQNDIFADDLPDNDQSLAEEFEIQAKTLKEMKDQIFAYEKAGKVEAALRLQDQMMLLEKRFTEIRVRYQKFLTGTSDLEPRLSRVLRELRGVEEATCLLDIDSDDPEGLEGHLKHCMRYYRTLSDLKGEVEAIIKRGRQVVEENSSPDPEKLTLRLDALKELYNKLGSQITESQKNLENAQELSLSIHKDIPALNEWIDMVESELDERESLPIARRDLESEKAFLKELLEEEVPQWQTMLERVRSAYDSFSTICDPVYLESLRDRVQDVARRWDQVIERAKSTRTAVEGIEQAPYQVSKDLKEGQPLFDPHGGTPNVSQNKTIKIGEESVLSTCEGISNLAFDDEFEEEIGPSGSEDKGAHAVQKSSIEKHDAGLMEVLCESSNLLHKQEVLSDTFRLDKDSSLFSQVSANNLETESDKDCIYHEPVEQKVQMVEIKALEIIKPAVESLEVYPSSSCHLGPQTVEMVEIVEDTEESAPDTDSESPALVRKIPPLPVHVKSFSEILLKGKGSNSPKLSRAVEKIKPVHVVELKPEAMQTPPLCLEMTDRVNRMEETTVTAWRKLDSADAVAIVSDNVEKQAGPKVTLRKEVEVSRTYQVIGSYSPELSGREVKEVSNREPESQKMSMEDLVAEKTEFRRGKRVVSTGADQMNSEFGSLNVMKRAKREPHLEEASDEESFYGSDKETDDVVEFSDEESVGVATPASLSRVALVEASSSSDDEDFSCHFASGKAALSAERKVANVRNNDLSGDYEKLVDDALKSYRTNSLPGTSSLYSNVADFEADAQRMLERMDSMLLTVRNINQNPDPIRRLEILEHEMVGFAPDAATLISRGDGLILQVHASDPDRAELLKKNSQDRLRSKWSQVMSETEMQKTQAQKIEAMVRDLNKLVPELDSWLAGVKRKILHANNDQDQLQVLHREFAEKEALVQQLSELSTELDIQQASQSAGDIVKPLTARWTEVREELQRLQKTNQQDKFVAGSESNVAADFVVRVNKVRELTSSVSRQLNAHPLGGRDYDAFPLQEEALRVVRERLAAVKPQVEALEKERDVVVREAVAVAVPGPGQVRRVLDKLREEWAQANRLYAERHSRWLTAQEVWQAVHADCQQFADWLDSAERLVHEWKNVDLSLDMARAKQKDLEKQVTVKHRIMSNLSSTCRDVTGRPGPDQDPSGKQLSARVEDLRKRWQAVLADLTAQRDKIAASTGTSTSPSKDKESPAPRGSREAAQTCLDRVACLLTSAANPSDDTSLSVRLSMVKARDSELQKHRRDMEAVKRSNQPPSPLEPAMSKASSGLAEHREYLECKLSSLRRFTTHLDAVIAWVMETKTQINIARDLSEPDRSRVVDSVMAKVTDRETEVTDVLENYNNLEKECEGAKQPVSVELQEKIRKLRDDWNFVKMRGDPVSAAAAVPDAVVTPVKAGKDKGEVKVEAKRS